MIESGFDEFLHILFIGQSSGVRVQPRDLSIGFCVFDQLWQVVSKSGFAACADNMRNAQAPEPVEDLEPLSRTEFGKVSFPGVVAMCAVIITAIGDCQIHSIWGGGMHAEGHERFKFDFMDRAVPIRADQFFELKYERGKILPGLQP